MRLPSSKHPNNMANQSSTFSGFLMLSSIKVLFFSNLIIQNLLLSSSLFNLSSEVLAVDKSKFRTCDQGSFCRRFQKWSSMMTQAVANLGGHGEILSKSETASKLPVRWVVIKPSDMGKHGYPELVPDPNSDKTIASSSSSVKIPNDLFSFYLWNTNESRPTLTLKLMLGKNGSVRFVVNELDPIHKRYTIPMGDVLVNEGDSASAENEVTIQENSKEISSQSGGKTDTAGAGSGAGSGTDSHQKFTSHLKTTTFEWTANTKAQISVKLVREPNFYLELFVDGVLTTSINRKANFNFEIYRDPSGYGVVKDSNAPQELTNGNGIVELSSQHSDSANSAVTSYTNPNNLPVLGKIPDSSLTVDAAHHPGMHSDSRLSEGLWEEYFGSHRDQKPRGPASLGVDISFEGEVNHIFGLPEHATGLSLKDYGDQEPYRFYNLDVFEYILDSPMALYGAVPMLWGNQYMSNSTSSTSSSSGNSKLLGTTGILWNNPSETFVKIMDTPTKINEKKNSITSQATALAGSLLNTIAGGGVVPPNSDLTPRLSTWWSSESGVMDIVLFPGPTARHVSWQFHEITGFAPLPPLFSIGKHQCRWNYVSERDALEVNSKFNTFDIPYDVLWLDIEHTNGKRYFTWDDKHFPNPAQMTNQLSESGRKLVTIVDPHIKASSDYSVYNELLQQDLLMKKRDYTTKKLKILGTGSGADVAQMIPDPNVHSPPEGYNEAEDGKWERPLIVNPEYRQAETKSVMDVFNKHNVGMNQNTKTFEGWCWPGQSVYPDFTNPQMRSLWSSKFDLSKYQGTTLDTFTWNDMNEPSVFNGPEVSSPRDALHMGEVEHRDVHNLYGMYVQRATFEGHLQHKSGKRPFVLSRSFFTGSHRYGAIWTGDNMANWEHLKASTAMVLSHALGGISFIGADVGGFFKNPTPELMLRWYQFGSLAYPFFRNHAHIETTRREPWTMLPNHPNYLEMIKDAIKLRYQLLPYYYTLFAQYSHLGTPIIRPLWYEFGASDPINCYRPEIGEEQLLIGHALITKAIAAPNAQQLQMYLPMGKTDMVWYDFHNPAGQTFRAGSWVTTNLGNTHSIQPLFVAAGRIVPQKWRQRKSSALTHKDPFTLSVFVNPRSQFATGRLYIDDYVNTDTPSIESKIDFVKFAAEKDNPTYAPHPIPVLKSTVVARTTIAGADVSQTLEQILSESGLMIERILIYGVTKEIVTGLKRVLMIEKEADTVGITAMGSEDQSGGGITVSASSDSSSESQTKNQITTNNKHPAELSLSEFTDSANHHGAKDIQFWKEGENGIGLKLPNVRMDRNWAIVFLREGPKEVTEIFEL